jgi:hypothetical protein
VSRGRANGAPARRLLLLLLLFFALTLPLAWLWIAWGEGVYARFLLALLEPGYAAMGLRHQRGGPVAPRLVSLVPFVVLMAITPGMGWRRRAVGTLVGLAVILCFHLLLFLLVDSAYVVLGRTRRALAKIVPFLLINDGIPFLIWLFFARDFLREIVPAFGEAPRERRPPPGAG